MTYQVFAVKTRPQSFAEVIGQEPIISAIKHAIDKNKVHHAYLFTGTRGVGKTTIARIIAKSLNCLSLNRVDAEPCNQCNNCLNITAGCFPDLIEIDAASKTKVEDTRALLDTVIYAPTQGKYKIYLIDEVHMLSTHSFNALLKTLEEPPSYVKFLLATTEPEKIPATILSRCLQFTLKWVSSDILFNHMVNILAKDSINYEPAGLKLIATAAHGSVRDGLSLLEQAVAVGAGEVSYERVRLMLGRTSGVEISNLLDNIITKNSKLLLMQVNNLALAGADFAQLLTQLIGVLHQIAVYQQAPDLAVDLALVSDIEIQSDIARFAQLISPEDVQIFYQIVLLAKRDLPYSPQPKLAAEMTLIRMLSFVPVNYDAGSDVASNLSSRSSTKCAEPGSNTVNVRVSDIQCLNKNTWPQWLSKLDLKAMALQLVKNCEFEKLSDSELILTLDHRFSMLLNPARQQEIEAKVQHSLNKKIKLIINKNDSMANPAELTTPAVMEQADQQKKHEDLVVKLQNDPNVREIKDVFNGELRLDSVELT